MPSRPIWRARFWIRSSKNGKVVRGYLGAWIQPVTPDIAKIFNLKQNTGALIGDVEPGSPADRAGLKRGDVVIAADGQAVTDSAAFRLKTAMTAPGKTVELTIVRSGAEQRIPVVLGEMPSREEATKQGQDGSTTEPGTALKGMSVATLTPEIAGQLGISTQAKGVVVTGVERGSAAEEAGIERGDVIQEVNRKPVTNVGDFQSLVQQAAAQPVLLLINRQGKTSYLVVQP